MSVVVPVFRPGPSFDDLIASLDRQTLGTSAFEVLLCDDGSGEPTGARLAAIARDRPHVRVLSLEHSGWPGMPRNHGVDAARGTYVQFVDQDDWLFDEALELARLAQEAGIKNGVVHDKLYLPGLQKLRRLIDSGFFGRILSVRGEFGYWVFEGDWQSAQRPSWNYRAEDGGGIETISYPR